MTVVFDPADWLESLIRALLNYVNYNVDPPGLYNVVEGFPPTETFTNRQPLKQTIIHFEPDDIRNPRFGFGDNVVDNVYDDTVGTVVPIEAKVHRINWDVGIWASEDSGGENARRDAYKFLTDIFVGTLAYRALRDGWGIEAVSFDGANFIQEEINDIAIWRVAGMALVTQVFSQTTPRTPIPYISYPPGIIQEPHFEDVDDNPITDDES